MESMKKVYFPNLDGLRFYAFLAVFFAHSFWTEFDYMRLNPAFHFLKEVAYKGVLGVNFFFVLSGFLITYLLLEEKAATGKVNIPAFYMRRILRIWPLYYFVVFVGFVVVPFVQSRLGQPTPERGNILYYLAFLGNFDVKPTSAVLGILWSIAVEEQFYLVWPVVFSIVPPRYYWFLFPVIIAISIPMQQMSYPASGSLLYASPFVCMADLAMGGWCAYGVFSSEKVRTFLLNLSRQAIVGIYVIGIAYFFAMYRLSELTPVFGTFGRLFLSIFFGFIILEQNYSVNSFFKVSNFKTVSVLGLYTYSLYMLHFMCIYVVNKVLAVLHFNTQFYQVLVVQTVITFVASIVIAWLSFNYLEKFFLSLKHRFNARNSPAAKVSVLS